MSDNCETATRYEVACYHWSNWHRSPENDRQIGKDWTEWEYVKTAIPRFVGHQQPKKPLWGYLDDSLPEVAELQIDAAADHGITAFIFDWNWVPDDGEGGHSNLALNQGFLNAKNRDRLKFCLMWCGAADDAAFDYIIEQYFSSDRYLRVDGGLYLSIYNLQDITTSYGGLAPAAAAFSRFREKTRAAGLGEIHLNIIEWSLQEDNPFLAGDPAELIRAFAFDSVGTYTWAHNTSPQNGLSGSYREWMEDSTAIMGVLKDKFPIPYHPNVSMGWDPSPRCPADRIYKIGGPLMYPKIDGGYDIVFETYLSSIVCDNSPDEFRRALLAARKQTDADERLCTKLITLYAWNEWTEGGFLEPEAEFGMGYLEAIRDVFPPCEREIKK